MFTDKPLYKRIIGQMLYGGSPVPEPINAVKFTAEQSNSTISLSCATGTNYKYSTDGETFNAYTSGTTIMLANVGDSVWFQGVHNENVTYSTTNCSQFTMTGKIAASGNCNWLLDPDFADDDTLPMYCYVRMFRDCTSLTAAPDLPATTLNDRCYVSMFDGCTNLIETPDLPATILAANCYSSMFTNCTSLTTVSELPATTLFSTCYYNMFSGCTSLTTAPDLPAQTLTSVSYYNMFYGCASLNSITIHATTMESNSLNNWLFGVASTGTLKCQSSLTLPSGPSGLPSGWTRVNL